MTEVPSVTLNNGVEMPILGFGVFQVPAEDTQQVVEQALAAGYRRIDTAAYYRNEEGVGRAVKASGIAREELFVTTKLWIQKRSGEDVAKAKFAASLGRLGMDYVDLYLIHQPFGDYYSSWRALQDLLSDGSATAIGVSNFRDDRLIDLIEHNEIVPAVNQVETHPFNARFADQKFMAGAGVQIESWAPFARGRNDLFSNPMLVNIAIAHDRTVAQVVLRWLVQRGVAVVPKSVHPERIAENLDVFDFELADDEMAQIATLDTGESSFFSHTDPETVSRLNSLAEP